MAKRMVVEDYERLDDKGMEEQVKMALQKFALAVATGQKFWTLDIATGQLRSLETPQQVEDFVRAMRTKSN